MGIIQSFIVIITIILFGVYFQRAKILNTIQIEGFGIFLLKLAMPCFLFSSTLQHDLQAILYTEYILSFFLAFIIVIAVVGFFYYQHTTKMGLCIKMLAAGYPNAIIYTLPIITFLLNDPTAGIIGNILQIVVIQSIFVMIMSFIRHREHSFWKKIWMVFTTPLILAPILGILCNVTNFSPPTAIVQITQYIGNGATSIALFTFGLSIGEVSFSRQALTKPLLILVAIKNLLHPLVAWLVGAYIFSLENYWLYSLIIASSAPTAFVVYLLSKQFQIEEDLMKRTVAISSIVSLFSLLLITIFLL